MYDGTGMYEGEACVMSVGVKGRHVKVRCVLCRYDGECVRGNL